MLAGDLTIDVSASGPVEALPAAVETAAYRIAVEGMTNAVRHSSATHCPVSVAVNDEAVELLVQDDGHGLDPARTPGVGLNSMQERAAEVGGTLSIRSAAGGTLVTATLPLSLGGSVDHADPR